MYEVILWGIKGNTPENYEPLITFVDNTKVFNNTRNDDVGLGRGGITVYPTKFKVQTFIFYD